MAIPDLKILLIDDHEIVLRGMRHLIEDVFGSDCRVDTAMTAKDAMTLVTTRQYDLCLLDVELPDTLSLIHI